MKLDLNEAGRCLFFCAGKDRENVELNVSRIEGIEHFFNSLIGGSGGRSICLAEQLSEEEGRVSKVLFEPSMVVPEDSSLRANPVQPRALTILFAAVEVPFAPCDIVDVPSTVHLEDHIDVRQVQFGI